MNFRRCLPLLWTLAIWAGIVATGLPLGAAEKIEPGVVPDKAASDRKPVHTGKAVLQEVTDGYEAVGTIRPRTESRISAQLTAQVMDVAVRPGDRVTKDQVLIVLDDRQLQSRLDQAKQGLQTALASEKQARQAVIAAGAAFQQAEAEFTRIKTYVASQAATRKDLEQAESAFRQALAGSQQAKASLVGAGAGILQAEEVVREANIALGYTRIRAPEDGEVLERLVEPGDMALPGKVLVALRTAGALRMEAFVREGLIGKVLQGDRLPVMVTTLNRTVDAVVEEVIPYADPRTRTFLVKAALPEMAGLFPGMFAKLIIPVQTHTAVMIPAAAIRRVGQLELVAIREGGAWKSVYITSGRTVGDRIEVLSGLAGDEEIGWED